MTFNLSKLQLEESRNEVIIYDETSDIAAYKQFFISLKLRGLSDRSIQLYMYNIDKFNRFIAKPFKEISTGDIRTYIAHRTLIDKIANSTLDHERGVITRFFKWLYEEDFIDSDPGKRVEKIKVKKRLLESFTQQEVELLRAACDDVKKMMVLELLLSTACRVAELVTLKMENYDVDGGKISVIGKGNKERIVFIHSRAKMFIDAYLEKFPHKFGPIICGGDGIGSQMSTSGIQKMIKTIARKAGVEKAYPHKFRRTTATDASNHGMKLIDIKELLGHSSAETTLLYIDSSKNDLKAKHEKYVY
ncbi:tyrosine-type recombinase/integrase [Candidatus Enterococcus ferrettii]|uniref:Integrase n=1 Tax=Candidatus Enterococcus ferrettii TaxID=2815324 RepID=A0ABV0EWM4_9ENTE|nr:tyrosine-type recombinase/integrase [Enterococcus sp. 665A]MBO1342108.1 tyrosine-type recombinase/integrase [Enterococcus sp. 665A]